MIPRKSPLRRVSAKQKAKYPDATKYSTVVKRGGKPKEKSYEEKIEAARKLKAGNPARRSRRRQKNQDYYKSAEWRAKRKAVFERDGYRCVEMIPYVIRGGYYPDVGTKLRCPNMGMNVNGKQTGKGLVCEEKSYGHRGVPGRIDTCVTRCKECDRRLTPLERANHAGGFRR